ncbi:hypothetical protein [Longimicrobium sp.]|jgi:hypothetical protein|uniref:hypothetical protein n=1 Tax=Longimicrobium sp. TaxID=2029185 RepID=UPI002EDB954F
MNKVIASLALVALAACGGGNEAGAVVEDTTSIPATSEAPAVSPAPADSTMMQGTVVDSAAAVRGTAGDSATGTTQQ